MRLHPYLSNAGALGVGLVILGLVGNAIALSAIVDPSRSQLNVSPMWLAFASGSAIVLGFLLVICGPTIVYRGRL